MGSYQQSQQSFDHTGASQGRNNGLEDRRQGAKKAHNDAAVLV